MSIQKIFVGADVHDGTTLHQDSALIVHADGRLSIVPRADLTLDGPMEVLDGGTITPGFVDLQVNGGGGVMFNDAQTVETLSVMAQAHSALGTAAFLPTLITDTPERTSAAIDAVEQAIAAGVEGVVGLHLEGPHLSVARKGAHDPDLIRPMTQDDLNLLLEAVDRLPNLMVTVAPENVTDVQIRQLSGAGVVVSLGHTDADYDTCMAAFDAGARCVTHLFNAMSQLGSRAPGLVGATLQRDDVFAGLIADGIHVHPATMRTALDACGAEARVFLVTDAMAPAGSAIDGFALGGRLVKRQNQRLALADGTLAGADLDMARAVCVLVDEVGEDIGRTLYRATKLPAKVLRNGAGLGCLEDTTRKVLHLPRRSGAPSWLSVSA